MTAQQIIQKYLDNFFSAETDFVEMRNFLTDDFSFSGPLMEASSADEYIGMLKAMGIGNIKADMLNTLSNEEQVAVLYELITPVGNQPTVEWFWIREGKIKAIRLLNDPRPFLELFGNG